MNTVEHLRATRALLTPEGAWTQGVAARNKERRGVAIFSQDAVCWSLAGALFKTNAHSGNYSNLCNIVLSVLNQNRYNLIFWNDTPGRKQAEVLDVLDKTIALAEAQS